MSYNIKELSKRWKRISSRLRADFGENSFKKWIHPIEIVNYENNTISLSVKTEFLKKWIVDKYLKRILYLWKIEISTIDDVCIICIPAEYANDVTDTPIIDNNYNNSKKIKYFQLDPNLSFDNFIVSESNEMGFNASKQIANEKALFNILYIHGSVGLGKTHLIHAISNYIQDNYKNKKILYLSSEKFVTEFISAIRNQDTIAFKENLTNIDVLLIDDIQFISNKTKSQEVLLYIFNTIINNKCKIVLSSNCPPSELNNIDERLKSRMCWGMVAKIDKTNFELRYNILKSKAKNLNINVNDEVIHFLSDKITSNIRELEGALHRINTYTSLENKPITIEKINYILHDVINNKIITIQDIQKSVAKYYNITIEDLKSPCRRKNISRPRQLAIYLAKTLTYFSMPEIGKCFGGRDHTTVIYAISKIEQLTKEDENMNRDIQNLKYNLK